MKRKVIAFVFIYLVALIILAPAQLLAVLLNHYSQGKLSLVAPDGSAWRGSAHVIVNADHHRILNVGKISWDIHAVQMMAGKMGIQIIWNDTIPFWIFIEPTRVRVERANLSLPAEILETFIPVIATAKLGGKIDIHCDYLSITSKEIIGKIDMDWLNVTSQLSTLNPVGSYHVTWLVGNGAIQLKPIGNAPLILQGTGNIDLKQNVHFNGMASAQPEHQQALKQVLQMIGNEAPVGSGQYKISF